MNAPERLQQIIVDLGMSNRAVELRLGKSNGYIKSQMKNNGNIGIDVLQKLHEIYPQYNIMWVLTGEGEMKITPQNITSENIPRSNDNTIDDLISYKIDKKIQELQNELELSITNQLENKFKEIKYKTENLETSKIARVM